MKIKFRNVFILVFMHSISGDLLANTAIGEHTIFLKEQAKEFGIAFTNNGNNSYTLTAQGVIHGCLKIDEYEFHLTSKSLDSGFSAGRKFKGDSLVEKFSLLVNDGGFGVVLVIKYMEIIDDKAANHVQSQCDRLRGTSIVIPLTESVIKNISQ